MRRGTSVGGCEVEVKISQEEDFQSLEDFGNPFLYIRIFLLQIGNQSVIFFGIRFGQGVVRPISERLS